MMLNAQLYMFELNIWRRSSVWNLIKFTPFRAPPGAPRVEFLIQIHLWKSIGPMIISSFIRIRWKCIQLIWADDTICLYRILIPVRVTEILPAWSLVKYISDKACYGRCWIQISIWFSINLKFERYYMCM